MTHFLAIVAGVSITVLGINLVAWVLQSPWRFGWYKQERK